MNWKEVLHQWKYDTFGVGPNANTEYYSVIDNRDSIVVALGDSWTYGDSLPNRHQQMYGNVLATRLSADLLNIGCCGWSNSYVLDHLEYIVSVLNSSSYKKIYIVLTLTENGRDIGDDRNFPYSAATAFDKFGESEEFYNQVLADIEQFWVDRIKQIMSIMDSRYVTVVGQNFVWHNNVYASLKDSAVVPELNWIECIADAQGLNKPNRTPLVTGWVFDGLEESTRRGTGLRSGYKFKSWAIPLLEQATEVNAWLDTSPMNYDKASKHPNADGHRVWANYILNNLQKA